MSLILKQEDPNTIPTPPTGKDTLFVSSTNGTLNLKDPSGNISTFTTTTATDEQVLFVQSGNIVGDANLLYDYANANFCLLYTSPSPRD